LKVIGIRPKVADAQDDTGMLTRNEKYK